MIIISINLLFFFYTRKEKASCVMLQKNWKQDSKNTLIQRAFKCYRWCGKSYRRKKKRVSVCNVYVIV